MLMIGDRVTIMQSSQDWLIGKTGQVSRIRIDSRFNLLLIVVRLHGVDYFLKESDIKILPKI